MRKSEREKEKLQQYQLYRTKTPDRWERGLVRKQEMIFVSCFSLANTTEDYGRGNSDFKTINRMALMSSLAKVEQLQTKTSRAYAICSSSIWPLYTLTRFLEHIRALFRRLRHDAFTLFSLSFSFSPSLHLSRLFFFKEMNYNTSIYVCIVQFFVENKMKKKIDSSIKNRLHTLTEDSRAKVRE